MGERDWVVQPHSETDKRIPIGYGYDPSGHAFAWVDNDDVGPGEGEEKAAVIVRAVNAHEDLCRNLQLALQWLDALLGDWPHEAQRDSAEARARRLGHVSRVLDAMPNNWQGREAIRGGTEKGRSRRWRVTRSTSARSRQRPT
jgi:hypothetical protein